MLDIGTLCYIYLTATAELPTYTYMDEIKVSARQATASCSYTYVGTL